MRSQLEQALPITVQPIRRPAYRNTDSTLASFVAWLRANQALVLDYWSELEIEVDATADFFDFAASQYDIACSTVDDEVDSEDDSTSDALCNAWQDTDSAAAGVPMYGPL